MSIINHINEQGQTIYLGIMIASNYLHIKGLIDPEPEMEEESKDGEKKQKHFVNLEGWDEKFIGTFNVMDGQVLSIYFDIIITANYLHNQGLIDITTMEEARKIENKLLQI